MAYWFVIGGSDKLVCDWRKGHIGSAWLYLNSFVFKYVFKYICVLRKVFIKTLMDICLNSVFKYFNEYLKTMYLNTEKIIQSSFQATLNTVV